MVSNVLIIGHGLCGAWLGYYLEKAGIPFEVIDQDAASASSIASGVINPVTGRRLVKTWLIDTLLPFCRNAYQEAANATGKALIEDVQLIDFHTTTQMKHAFHERLTHGADFLKEASDESAWTEFFQYAHGYGIVEGCLLVQIRAFLAARKERLTTTHQLHTEEFDSRHLQLEKGKAVYKGTAYEKVIFCDGAQGFHHPWFQPFPFAACKGEALWIAMEGMPRHFLFKKGITLIPWENEMFWAGSSYEWSFQDTGPTAQFRNRCLSLLKGWIKRPFQIIDHRAAVRPATRERRPVAGFHPTYKPIGILNGMGTKGCSLAPYFAHGLTEHMVKGTALHPEATISRFF